MRWCYGSLLLCVGALALAPARATAEDLGVRDKLKARNAEGMIDDAMKESVRGRPAQASLNLKKAEIEIDELALRYGRNQADVKRLHRMLAEARARTQGSAQASAGKPQAGASQGQGGSGSSSATAGQAQSSGTPQAAHQPESPGAEGQGASGSGRTASGRSAGQTPGGASHGKEATGSSAPRTRQAGSSGSPGDGSDKMARLARAKGGNIDATIDSALKSSDLVDQVTLENQKRNNLVAARDKLRQAKESIDRLSAQMGASDPEVQRLSKRLDDARSQIYARHGAQLEAMLASVQAPQSLYRASDRGEWEQRIRALWTKLRPNDQILGVRFDQANWVKGEATTTSEESVSMNAKLVTKTYTPEESLRVCVVVKASDKIATIYHVYCRRDLTNGQTSLGFSSDGGIHFGAEMLLANFK